MEATETLLNKELEIEKVEFLKIDQESIEEFKNFIKEKEDFLATGLGAFHTDNHGNW